jgi:hypothetical protein
VQVRLHLVSSHTTRIDVMKTHRRIIHAIMSLIFISMSCVSFSANQKPTDVPTPLNPPVHFAAGTTLNRLGINGTATTPDTPPFYASQGPDYLNSDVNSWIFTGSFGGTSNFCDYNPGAGCGEAKFRTEANSFKVLCDDMIRAFHEPRGSHCHEFFGNKAINADSTFQGLRQRPASTAAGGPDNGTGYWIPIQGLTIGGNAFAAKSAGETIYYNEGLGSRHNQDVKFPNKLRFVTGTNMDDPDDLGPKAEIAAANAQPGTAGRYSYIGNGYGGIDCFTNHGNGTGVGNHKWFKNTDGTDPWGGACVSGSRVVVQFGSPNCWNGYDPWAVGGYNNMRHEVYDNVAGAAVCPDQFYRVVTIELKINYDVLGFSDYGNRRCSSDNAAGVAAGRTFRNCESYHADWFGGWNRTVLDAFQLNCNGIGGPPHQCATSVFSSTQGLVFGPAPDGSRNPQVDITPVLDPSNPNDNYRIWSTKPTGHRTFTIQ